jgi:pimeloyl-ACP methyl ester carboxylesterase
MSRSQDMQSSSNNDLRFGVSNGLRPVFRALSRLAPGLAVRIAADLFTRPQRPSRPGRERRWLATAHPRRLDVAGRRLAAWSWGEGPVVLLVHGWSGRGSQLAALAEPLLEAGLSVMALDLPAHGDSDGRKTNAIELGRTVLSVGRELHDLHAVVAHSLGCTVTALALQQGLRLQRLVFLCPPASMRLGTQMFCDRLGFSQRVQDGMIAWWERRMDIDWRMFEAESLARGRSEPLLIVQDRDDPFVPRAHGERFRTAWPGAKLVETEGLGHHRILSDEGVIRWVVDFLTEGEAQRSSRT